MDTTTLMMMMMMSGNNRSSGMSGMLLPLMLMGGGTALGSLFTSQNLMLAMMPGIGNIGKLLLGGPSALALGSLFGKPKRRRRYYRRNYYRNYRRRY